MSELQGLHPGSGDPRHSHQVQGMMRCQYVLDGEFPCVRAGMFKYLVRLPTGDGVVFILCHVCSAHEQALGAIEWAERRRA